MKASDCGEASPTEAIRYLDLGFPPFSTFSAGFLFVVFFRPFDTVFVAISLLTVASAFFRGFLFTAGFFLTSAFIAWFLPWGRRLFTSSFALPFSRFLLLLRRLANSLSFSRIVSSYS